MEIDTFNYILLILVCVIAGMALEYFYMKVFRKEEDNYVCENGGVDDDYKKEIEAKV